MSNSMFCVNGLQDVADDPKVVSIVNPDELQGPIAVHRSEREVPEPLLGIGGGDGSQSLGRGIEHHVQALAGDARLWQHLIG